MGKCMLHRGKIARDREVKAVRELRREDLEVLRPPRPAPVVQKFRDTHHWVARLLVAGHSVTAVAEMTGYSINRICQLRQVPAFQDLMSSYRNIVDDGYKGAVIDYMSLKMANRLKAERQLSEKLDEADENEELLTTRELISISREVDRNTNIQVNIGDFAQQLDRAAARSKLVLDSTPVRHITTQAAPPTTSAGQAPRRKLA